MLAGFEGYRRRDSREASRSRGFGPLDQHRQLPIGLRPVRLTPGQVSASCVSRALGPSRFPLLEHASSLAARPWSLNRAQPGSVAWSVAVVIFSKAMTKIPGSGADLVAAVVEANNELRVTDPKPTERAAWRRAIYALINSDATPPGLRLRHTGRDRGDLVIRLVPDTPANEPAPRYPNRSGDTRPPIATTSSDCGDSRHRRAAKDGMGRHPPDRRRAASMSPQAVCAECCSSRTQRAYSFARIPEWDPGPSGRVQLKVGHSGYDQRLTGDRKSWKLEDRLALVFEKIEALAAETERRRLEAQARDAKRKVAWQAALERAHERHREAARAEHLQAQVDQWRRANEICAFVAHVRSTARKIRELIVRLAHEN
jgi:hypothetical protein